MGGAYLCIDLKCFYASVECVDRGRNPFEHRLVVADPSRGRKTICLAISPAMKALGVRNRCRVFEIPDGIDYEMARPRMRRYMEVSADIYARYLRYFSPEDIHVYSVDEVFIDVTPYLALYGKTPRELAVELIDMVRRETGICATAGIGTNLFLAKVALDVTAKHTPDNIGELDEERYKCLIWPHRPITDIWGIGPGIARRLAQMGAHDMGGVALLPEKVLYDEFGVNAELLIDHAWGVEPCTMAEIHAYRPKAHSMGSGQVLMRDYAFDEAQVVLREMVDNLALELVDKGLVCGHVSLFVGYAHERGAAGEKGAAAETFTGEHSTRVVGRRGEGANVSRKLAEATSSRAALAAAFLALYAEIVDPNRAVRRVNISVGELAPEEYAELTLFSDPAADAAERSLARAEMAVKRRFGKNALVRGISYRPEATGRARNEQVGGHHE
ncbi:MAG: DNA repair protein [Atopobiaceae bacterium]|nr:DNA repair protein [Atopobiaceae bacterium]